MVYDCVIIGSGVAGLTAAIYLRRANKTVMIIEDTVIGGTTANLDLVENYPGFTKISGYELVQNIVMQASQLGANINIMSIKHINYDNNVVITDKTSIQYKSLIIASGMAYNKLNLDEEVEFRYKGLSYCALCDGPLYKNKKIVVATNGNTGRDAIEYLKNITSDLIVIDAHDSYIDNDVEIYSNSIITKINGVNKIDSLEIQNSSGVKEIPCDGLFVSLGKSTNIELYKESITTKNGFIVTDENMHTNLNGVFAAGDVRDKSLRQIVTACADGAIAATEAIKFLQINNIS